MEERFMALWEHRRMVYAYFLKMILCPETAEDLTQEVYLKVYRALPSSLPINSRAWLMAIARNVGIDYLRSQGRHPISAYSLDTRYPETGELVHDTPDAIALEEQVCSRAHIASTLARMTPLQAEVLVLAYVQKYRAREIGGMSGVSEPTAQSRIRLAKETFRKAYRC